MVVSRSDSKRRKKEEVDSLHESPKRTKVHAQRKFASAQGSHVNSPVLTPVKDKDKTKYNGAVPAAELLPIKRPKTEQFVNFLCFRGSDMLPKSLEFFNEPSVPEPLAGEEDIKREGASSSGGPSRVGSRTSDQAGSVAKAEARNKNKSKSTTAVQALKKKYQEQRLNKEKRSLTKLALKVKGKNMMRTRSAGPLDEKPAAAVVLQKKSVRTSRLVSSVKVKGGPASRKPVLRKHPVVVKRIPSRGGLRSAGGLPPGSDEGLKTERKHRKIIKMKASPLKKSVKKAAIASSLSDFSSDDDQPLVKKQRVVSKASILASRVTTRSRKMSKSSTSQTTSSRPPRKTKEAATLFMEMLKKDLRSPDEEEDNVDAMSVDSFGDAPKRTERRESKDNTENAKSEKKSLTKSVKKETKPNYNKLPGRNNRKLPDKSASRLTSLKTRTLRRNSYRLVAKEMELKRLKTARGKLVNKMPSRSSSKDMSQDNISEVEKTTTRGSSIDRDSRRDRTSSIPSKAPENKLKQQKTVTKESDLSSSKLSKKKASETTFDDSDEEPLGKKVNQSITASASKALKKTKQTGEKEETSHTDKADFLEQKSTRRRSVNATQDSSKEDLKHSAQSTVKAQQPTKNISSGSENENKGKVKPEPTIKIKAGDNHSGTHSVKSKLVTESANENSTNETQKQKEMENNTVQNKAQLEKKAKRSSVKGSEIEDKMKPLEEKINIMDKKKQANKNVKKSESRTSFYARGNEADSNPNSKDAIQVSEQKNSTDNIPKNEGDSTLKTSQRNLEKCNNLGKTILKKTITTSAKRAGNTKNKNDPASSAVCNKTIESDTAKPIEIKLPESKKVSVKSSDKITLSEECPLDSKTDKILNSNNESVFENLNTTMQTKPNKIGSEESISNPSKSHGNTNKKQSSSKKQSELSNLDSSQTTKVKTLHKDKATEELDESYKSSSKLKINSEKIGSSNPSLLGISGDKSISPENILPENTKEVDNLRSKTSQDASSKVYSKNNSEKQIPSSLMAKSHATAKDQNHEMVRKAPSPNDSTSKTNKDNLFEKTTEDNSNKMSNKSVNSLRNVTGDNKKSKGILTHDPSNRVVVTEPNFIIESQEIDSKLNLIASCTKGFSGDNEQDSAPESCYSDGATLFTSVTNSNNSMWENKSLELKDSGVSREVYSQQFTQPTKQQPTIQKCSINTVPCADDKLKKNRIVVLEPTPSKNLIPEGECLPASPALVSCDFIGKIPDQPGIKEGTVQTRDFKTDGRKLEIKEDNFIDTSKLGRKLEIKEDNFIDTSKLGSLDMSDKISSAVETLMSLKNVHKIDDKSFTIQTGVWNLQSGQAFDNEQKRVLEYDLKLSNESEQKYSDTHDGKKIKTKEGEVKRVTIQEPEFKRFSVSDTDNKRSNPHDSDFRRYHVQDHKPRPEHPQVLKGCSNPKSMLKPGTLIDIAGISHSPEIMTPLRPGVDGEIIPMNRPIRPFGQEIVDPFKTSGQGFKPYEPRVEPSTYGYRWQSLNTEKNTKPEHLLDKEVTDSKSKTPVNESAWRLAFKNVKDPKSSNVVPTEKPAVKKQLSVTALAKKHKSKSEIFSEKNTQSQSSTSIPFLRHNKPFLGPSPTKTKDAGSSGSDMKKTIITDVDPATLREKEAEVEEFLRQCGEYSRSLAPAVTHVNPIHTKVPDDINRSSNVKPPYLTSSSEEHVVTHSEQMSGSQHIILDVRYTPKPPSSHHDQSSSGTLFTSDSVKRAGSPLKFEKRQMSTGGPPDLSPYKSSLAGINSQQDPIANKQNSSVSYLKQDQSLNIFQSDSVRRSNSPKSIVQKSALKECTDTKSKFDESSTSSTLCPALNSGEQVTVTTFLVGTQQTSSAVNAAKQPLPDKVRHYSPNRSSQSVVSDHFFSDSNLGKRTKSPTLLDSYSQQNSSSKGNSITRNTNSPVFGKCSTTNIFKEIVPAKRSYSPTLLSTSQSDSEAVPNVFSQNPSFRRSVSPLSNRSGFSKLATINDSNIETAKKSGVIEQKNIETCSHDGLKNPIKTQPIVTSSISSSIEQQTMSPAVIPNIVSQPGLPLLSNKASIDEVPVKEEVIELDDEKNSNSVACEDSNMMRLDVKPFTQGGNENPSLSSQDIESGTGGMNTLSNIPGLSEAKHRLPLAVEQTFKKLGQTKSPQNKKSSKVQFSEQNILNLKNIQPQTEDLGGQDETVGVNLKDTSSVFTSKLSTGIYSHNQEGELDLMQKKKVNMSAEEIKRWLNDSSTSEVEHRVNCGILENNTCECEYRNTLTPNLQNLDTLKFETVSKIESICLNKPIPNQFDPIETTKKTVNSQENLQTPADYEAKHSFSDKEKDEKDTIKDIKKEDLCGSEAASVLKHESKKSAVSSNKNTATSQLKEDGLVSIKSFCVPVSVGSFENIKQPPTTPPASKLRTFRLPNKNVDIEPKPTTSDTLDVCTPARDDASSSNDLSSSNEETPEKSHTERKSIFHQRRSTLKVKERRELLAPSVNAFSPENECSVYAFDPELPPTSTPFRRSKGKDGKSTSTTTDDEELTPSSNSIAVQVNFDNEAVLECSTQTDVQEGDDDDTHTFYIPLQQSAVDTNKPPLIQGVAVKVDTEGPDQKVIMRAKLVTKPLSTFNQSSSSQRSLIGTRSGKPEQKVRPLSVKPPVGTVQPTARPKPKPTQDDQPGPSKSTTSCSPQAARLAKRIKSKAAVPSTSADNHPPKVPPAKLVEAPTFYPTEKEFEDPLEYISSITPQAEKYGLCRVVPPSNFKPECKVSDDMRFTAYNQYIHKMLHRWGPNVKEMLAIKKYLATQSIALTHPPWIGGMEVDLPRLYQTVQQCGGLKEVIEKKRWHRVADLMKIPKSAQDRVTKLDDIYCKFLLPYDTLSHVERTQLFEGVERDWIEREKRVANQQEATATDDDEDSDSDSDSDIDECIVKGRSMALSGFYRIARNTMSMWFPKTDSPSAADVELEFWKHVASRQHHVCVHSGSIDSGAMGYGFPTGKNSSTSRHPWNLKMLTNNPGSILRFLGPIMGVTVPTLHVGMLFSACCWYRDPHGLPWIEYLHTGASKIWYGIPDSSSSQFRDAVISIVPRLCQDKTLWLASDTAMVPPPLLVEKGVSLSRIVQEPGQFIIVFPKAFTSSICTGYVVSESVYFAQPSWLSTALTLFNDMRESSEPTVFSLEKLLFSIVNDSRASGDVLNQILGIVVSLRDGEVAGRRQLEELGLNTSERLNSKRKGKARPAGDGEEDLECEECRMTLYISWMSNSQDGSVYCLPHAVELLSNKRSQVKHCTLVYAFSEEELEELVEKLKSRVENKNQKKSVAKSSKS